MSVFHRRHRSTLFALLAALALAAPALAGPPLLCHPFNIGDARSLPWDGTRAFWQGRADYRLENLAADTEALLTPSTPVIVRMETLRRAALYAERRRGDRGQALRDVQRTAAGLAERRPGVRLGEVRLRLPDRNLPPNCRTRQRQERVPRPGSRAAEADRYDRRVHAHQEVARATFDRSRDGVRGCVDDGTPGRRRVQVHAERARAGAGRDPLLARNLNFVS